MSVKIKNKDMDMINGSLWNKLIIFAIPIILSGVFQQLFHSVDMAVIGKVCGSAELAAVGGTGIVVNLLVNTFNAFSVGANVTIAQAIGSGNNENTKAAIHTSIFLAFISGIVIMIVGVMITDFVLKLMATPADVIDLASVYLKIYFLGSPFIMVYNFSAAILRSRGQSSKPLYCLTIGGVINVALNLIFVIVFDMNVAGVGIATVISNMVSCFVIIYILCHEEGVYKLELKEIKCDKKIAKKIINIGFPMAIQASLFPLSNLLVSSSINSLGTLYMAGNAAGGAIESYAYLALAGFDQANITFTSQNFGAGKMNRCRKILLLCMGFNLLISLVVCGVTGYFREGLLLLFTSDMQVLQIAAHKMIFIYCSFPIFVVMNIFTNSLRGIGYSAVPTIASIVGICGFRVLWLLTVFKKIPTYDVILTASPISWGLVAITLFIVYIVIIRKIQRKTEQ